MRITEREHALEQQAKAALADNTVTKDEVDGLIRSATAGPLTSPMLATMTTVLDATDRWIPSLTYSGNTTPAREAALDAHERLQEHAKLLLWAAPRDVTGLAGQELSLRSLWFPKSQTMFQRLFERDDLAIRVNGTCAHATTLSFTLADERVDVAVPAGASASETAELIARTINARARDILASNVHSRSLNEIEPQTCGSLQLDGIRARVKDGEVRMRVDLVRAGSD